MKYSFLEFEKKLNDISPVRLISFSGVKSPIEWECLSCGEKYSRNSADGILQRTSLCHNCFHKSKEQKEKEIGEIEKEIKKRGWEIEILDYNGKTFPGSYKCKKCGRIYSLENFGNILAKAKKLYCSKCQTRADFTLTLKDLNKKFQENNIDVISSPTDAFKNFELLCKNCGTFFTRSCDRARKNQGCPTCRPKGYELSYQEFLKRLQTTFPNEFEVLDAEEYHGIRNSKILVKHNCGFCFSKNPEGILKHGCPKCNKKRTKGEREIASILEKNNIQFSFQFFQKINNRAHFFDFYIPSKNTIIEFDGEQHSHPVEHFGGERKFKEIKFRDKEKDTWCKDNNITIVRVPYTELGNIENFLKSSTTILRE